MTDFPRHRSPPRGTRPKNTTLSGGNYRTGCDGSGRWCNGLSLGGHRPICTAHAASRERFAPSFAPPPRLVVTVQVATVTRCRTGLADWTGCARNTRGRVVASEVSLHDAGVVECKLGHVVLELCSRKGRRAVARDAVNRRFSRASL
eukprot:3090117-Prymnesium_polylepis.1